MITDAELTAELAGMLVRIEANYERETSAPGTRFAGRTLESVQAEALLRRVRERAGTPGREPAGNCPGCGGPSTRLPGGSVQTVHDEPCAGIFDGVPVWVTIGAQPYHVGSIKTTEDDGPFPVVLARYLIALGEQMLSDLGVTP